jgi:hypothetical protein
MVLQDFSDRVENEATAEAFPGNHPIFTRFPDK